MKDRSKTLYDRACHGWDGVEDVLFDRYPWAIGLILAVPVLLASILIYGSIT